MKIRKKIRKISAKAYRKVSKRWRKTLRLALKLKWAKRHVVSSLGSPRYKELFGGVKTYCMFIGYPRSGHSLVGSLLDAHPNMIIAHELNVLEYIRKGFSRGKIFYLLLRKSQVDAKAGRPSFGYSYAVPNQWQGRFTRLQVIGDKLGGGSTRRLRTHPELLQRLRDTVGIPIKFIHVIRNPYDNITTMFRRGDGDPVDLRQTVDYYFCHCETIADLKKQINTADLLEIRHEDFIAEPTVWLKKLCEFLGVESPEDYVRDCASIVYESPHKSRHEVPWTPELIELVWDRMKRFPFLQGYSYED